MSITNERAALILDECPWDATGGADAECCNAAAMGAKALRRASEVEAELARLRAELAKLRKPVEVLPAGIAEALKNCDIYGDDAYGVETPRHRLEAAILKFANERGG